MLLEEALKAGEYLDVPVELMEYERLYELVGITGWTPGVIDEQPAVTLDYLLAIRSAHNRAAAELSKPKG